MQIDRASQPPTAQDGNYGDDDGAEVYSVAQDKTDSESRAEWLRRARDAYYASTEYVDNNMRSAWENGIRAFNNQHPNGSKYAAQSYEKRSRLYRPKIRAVIRKNEAAAAAAFFSNMDVISITAEDQTSKAQIISAQVMKQLLQYRLKKTIPWFKTVLGGIQEAMKVGVVVAHIYWKYDKQRGIDEPCIELIPIENFRFDPSASWVDVIGTSPYLIHLMPMYVMDIKAKQASGEWYDDVPLTSATCGEMDTTRQARNKDAQDPTSIESRAMKEYEIAWVQRHIHRHDGIDYEFYTLGDYDLLSAPVPLSENVFHGKRPYVVGTTIVEAHRVLSSGVPELAGGIAEEMNEIANQRIDNVKFVLNKKWFGKRGVELDVPGLVRNVPGGVVLMNDPINDVREISWPDVTQSSYLEQQGLDLLMDELLGNFNPAAIMMSGAANAPARNMALLNNANGTLVEYLLLTFVQTFMQPVLYQLVLLEQYYETDRVILGLAAKNSQLLQRFGIDAVTDELLMQALTIVVDVGMGATDPSQKLNKFLTAMGAYGSMMKSPIPGLDMVEVGKEIFGHLGYSDGARFFNVDNPQVVALQQRIQQLMQLVENMKSKLDQKSLEVGASLKRVADSNATKERIALIKEDSANKRALATHMTAIANSTGRGGINVQ